MRRNHADRIKAILQELDLSIGSDERNKETLHKFLADHGYKGYKNYNTMKNYYEGLKTKNKTEVFQHFNVDLTASDDLDTKLNQLLRDQQSDIQDPTLGKLMKWCEQKKVERSQDLEHQQH